MVFRGCFLTSSLLATVATSMTIPIALLVDVLLKHLEFSAQFCVGAVFTLVGFLLVTAYTHFEKWDPVSSALHCAYATICHRTINFR